MGCCCSRTEDEQYWSQFVESSLETTATGTASRARYCPPNPSRARQGSDGYASSGSFSRLIDVDDFNEQYVRHEQLGYGTSALVFRVVDRRTGEEYACKQIEKEPNCAPNPKVREEVATLKALNHCHIMRLVDVLETRSSIFIITELMRGRELFDNIAEREAPFTELDAAEIVARIASALSHMHARGVAHRDLKPENIMFASHDESIESLKLIDFGFSKNFRTQPADGAGTAAQLAVSPRRLRPQDKRPMSTMLGSRGYVAPEVLSGTPYSEAIDIFSLGVVTYSLLCGYLPFRQDSEFFHAAQQAGRRARRHARAMAKDSAGGGNARELDEYPNGGESGVHALPELSFEGPEWQLVSEEGRLFCSQLLQSDPAQRPSATDVLKHQWLLMHSRQAASASASAGVGAEAAGTRRSSDAMPVSMAGGRRQRGPGDAATTRQRELATVGSLQKQLSLSASLGGSGLAGRGSGSGGGLSLARQMRRSNSLRRDFGTSSLSASVSTSGSELIFRERATDRHPAT